MEERDLPDKLFAEDTLSYPNSVDGERPADEDQRASARQGTRHDTTTGEDAPSEDMLAVDYRAEEVRTAAPLEHTPSPEDLSAPGGNNPSPGADVIRSGTQQPRRPSG